MADHLLTPRTRIDRHAERGSHDRAVIEAILDEAFVCHVGFVHDGQPYVIPANFGRAGEVLYLHGSAESRLMRTLAAGAPVCLTVTLLDGLVLARSAFNHSVNYRSVVVIGRATAIVEREEKVRALRVIVDHIVPGRWDEVRPPTDRELADTTVVALRLAEASAKIRAGPPVDQPRDRASPVWAGVLPLSLTPGAAVADALTAPDAPVPGYLASYARRKE